MQNEITFPPAGWQEDRKSCCIHLPSRFSCLVLSSAASIHAHIQRVHTAADFHLSLRGHAEQRREAGQPRLLQVDARVLELVEVLHDLRGGA